MDLLEKLNPLKEKLREVEEQLGNPKVASDRRKLRDLGRTHSQLREIVEAGNRLEHVVTDLKEARSLAHSDDDDLAELARDEIRELEEKERDLTEQFRILLLPKDPDDERNAIMEIRAGTGGDEAGIFAGDLFRMYMRYAEFKKWKTEILNQHPCEAGGFKEVIFEIQGEGVFSRMKLEGGVHRVQRVPETESQGRIHTSTATVAVLPEAEEVEIDLPEKDIRVDRFCSTGPGGQSVNTTYSAIRLTHIPTGLVATCQDEKSQIKNLAKAMRVLRARLLERRRREEEAERDRQRLDMIGSGDRSNKIRTYNFPQSRITDHRINFTTHDLKEILDGGLDGLIEPLQAEERIKKMEDIQLDGSD